MCKECGCDKNMVGSVDPSKLTGKPTKDPHGTYEGVGGTNITK